MKTNFILGWATRRFAMCCLVGSLVFPVTALAANVAVDCGGQTPGAFTSLQAAIKSSALTLGMSLTSACAFANHFRASFQSLCCMEAADRLLYALATAA